MGRPIRQPQAGPDHPAWISTFDPADWADPADEAGEWWLDLVQICGPDRTREILAHGRWSDARRAYAADHGLTLRELGRPSFIGP